LAGDPVGLVAGQPRDETSGVSRCAQRPPGSTSATVLDLYQHANSPEAGVYLSRQLFEEAMHVQFHLNLLDTYVPDGTERYAAFTAIEDIPSLKRKADFCFRWIVWLAYSDVAWR
jgi:hypothetical protein